MNPIRSRHPTVGQSPTQVAADVAQQSAGVRLRLGGWWPVIVLFLALTALSTFDLYVMTERTDEFFAWTIALPLSAAFLGGGYGAGFLLMVLTAREPLWARNRIALVTVCVFVWATLAATLLHLDAFHFDATGGYARFSAWLWTAVYVVVPVWMTLPLLRQRLEPGTDPRASDRLPPVVTAPSPPRLPCCSSLAGR